jgi:hypothetical protein
MKIDINIIIMKNRVLIYFIVIYFLITGSFINYISYELFIGFNVTVNTMEKINNIIIKNNKTNQKSILKMVKKLKHFRKKLQFRAQFLVDHRIE